MSDLISVIVPVYNVEKYLDKCVDSIVNQTYKNLEIILVDDGSPDKCPEICDERAKKDDRIKVIHKENGGVSSARNTGLDIAAGEYVTFIDADDYISPDFVKTLFDKCKTDDLDICSCNLCRIDNKGNVNDSICLKNRLVVGNTNVLNAYFHDDFIDPSVAVKLYKKTVIKNVRFDEDIKVGEDFLFNYRCLKNASRVEQISDCLYYYEDRDGSAVHDLSAEYVNRWKNTKSIILENDNEEIKNVLLYKYQRELISCIRQLLASNNKNLIDECYDGICDELVSLHKEYPDIKSSKANKITLKLILFNRSLFKFLYMKYKGQR